MTSVEQILLFKRSADLVFNNKDYTSATVLYFKTLFAVHDFLLLKKIGYAPKDHSERFKLLKREYPEEYKILDREFNTYRSTYNRTVPKQTCLRVKRIVENAIDKNKIE